jgi:uncharacterized protein YqeY
MALLENIKRDLKEAMKQGEKQRLSALRMILSNVKNRQIEKKGETLEDEEILRIIQGLVRQSTDAISQFRRGNRTDLVAKEETFIRVCQAYLPEQLDEKALTALIRDTIDGLGAVSPREMGKVMKAVMPKVAGRADGKRVNQIVRAILSENSP